ncbi:Arginine biosynthesis bifunctional protein ArgJ [bacterium HR39]|nr:Arginine biosynthesis bifunctional protein ArgJ [bacterium HR39]
MAHRSPFAPARFPDLPPVEGVRLAAGGAGIRYRGRPDLMLAVFPPGTAAAGVFTRSAVRGHPVLWCERIRPRHAARALVVNAGNANVFRGAEGDRAVARTAECAAALAGCGPEEVWVASTGVIGERLPVERIEATLPALFAALRPDAFEDAARAIMTTDTYPKGAARTVVLDGEEVRISGIAKGSGMIAPDMATMLAFLFTDARIDGPLLQALLAQASGRTFDCITVDGDTSTSDMACVFATCVRGPRLSDPEAPATRAFAAALEEVCRDLALQIVRDGEGISKAVEIRVAGAVDDGSARRIGLTVANSPLVKTAIAGGDPNWGRVVAAVGRSGEPVDPRRLSVAFGGTVVARDGAAVPDLDEAPLRAHLAGREVLIEITVGDGPGRAVVWTCDLTHAYIDINASYRS